MAKAPLTSLKIEQGLINMLASNNVARLLLKIAERESKARVGVSAVILAHTIVYGEIPTIKQLREMYKIRADRAKVPPVVIDVAAWIAEHSYPEN